MNISGKVEEVRGLFADDGEIPARRHIEYTRRLNFMSKAWCCGANPFWQAKLEGFDASKRSHHIELIEGWLGAFIATGSVFDLPASRARDLWMERGWSGEGFDAALKAGVLRDDNGWIGLADYVLQAMYGELEATP